jgi:hypothetical protein
MGKIAVSSSRQPINWICHCDYLPIRKIEDGSAEASRLQLLKPL